MRVLPDVHIVFDCADPDRLARFWMVALPGYDFPHRPPDGFATWEEWADANQIPAEQRNSGRTVDLCHVRATVVSTVDRSAGVARSGRQRRGAGRSAAGSAGVLPLDVGL